MIDVSYQFSGRQYRRECSQTRLTHLYEFTCSHTYSADYLIASHSGLLHVSGVKARKGHDNSCEMEHVGLRVTGIARHMRAISDRAGP